MKFITPKCMKQKGIREQILKATTNVFIRKNYKDATTLEIAERANISKVTLILWIY